MLLFIYGIHYGRHPGTNKQTGEREATRLLERKWKATKSYNLQEKPGQRTMLSNDSFKEKAPRKKSGSR